jgi:hypothetical protein
MRRPGARRRRARGAVAGTILAAGVALVHPAPAAAAPQAPQAPQAVLECPDTLLDGYRPGDEVRMVGYAKGCIPDIAEPSPDGQPAVRAYLHPDPCADVADGVDCIPVLLLPDDIASGRPLGRLALDPVPHGPRGQRMTLTFRLPADLTPGQYWVMFCQDPCDPRLEPDPAMPIYVGPDNPSGRHVHNWPLDDPAIADLPDDALLLGPDGKPITAAQARAQPTTTTAGDGNDGNNGNGDGGGGDRVEVDAGSSDDGDGGPGAALWIPLAALVAAGIWVAGRLMPARKQIRRGGRGDLR